MARIEDIERRLLNWARWMMGARSGGLGFATVNLAEAEAGRDGYRESVIPTIDCEASETNAGILTLPSELRRTLEVVYVEGGGMESKARRLCVTVPTVHARVDLAHRKLSGWLADQAAARKAQRERVEQLQRAARP